MQSDLNNLMEIEDIETMEMLEMSRQPNRPRVRLDPFVELSGKEFRQKYRFTKRFAGKIVDLLKDHITSDHRGGSLSPEMQVVCALQNWARHEIQDDTADLHGVSQPYISRTCQKIAGILAHVSQRFLKMPATLEEQEETMRSFRSIANFPMVIGAIYCSHIRIKKVNSDGSLLFINRKGFASINVQFSGAIVMPVANNVRGNIRRRQFIERHF